MVICGLSFLLVMLSCFHKALAYVRSPPPSHVGRGGVSSLLKKHFSVAPAESSRKQVALEKAAHLRKQGKLSVRHILSEFQQSKTDPDLPSYASDYNIWLRIIEREPALGASLNACFPFNALFRNIDVGALRDIVRDISYKKESDVIYLREEELIIDKKAYTSKEFCVLKTILDAYPIHYVLKGQQQAEAKVEVIPVGDVDNVETFFEAAEDLEPVVTPGQKVAATLRSASELSVWNIIYKFQAKAELPYASRNNIWRRICEKDPALGEKLMSCLPSNSDGWALSDVITQIAGNRESDVLFLDDKDLVIETKAYSDKELCVLKTILEAYPVHFILR